MVLICFCVAISVAFSGFVLVAIVDRGATMLVSSWYKYLEGCLREDLAELASQKCLLGNASGFIIFVLCDYICALF